MKAEGRRHKAEGGGAAGGDTLVCFPLVEEARSFRKLASRLEAVRVVITGMGRRNTEATVVPLLEELKPAVVLTCGFAGGLEPGLALGTVLYETQDAALAARLDGAGLRPGRFHCSTRMAVTAAEKAALRRATGAEAVEMESAFLHELCRARGVPCATVRVISDVAGEDLPLDFNALTTPDMKLHPGRLALAVLRAPWKIPALLRLQRQSSAGAASLAGALARVLRGDGPPGSDRFA